MSSGCRAVKITSWSSWLYRMPGSRNEVETEKKPGIPRCLAFQFLRAFQWLTMLFMVSLTARIAPCQDPVCLLSS
ncbi:hypothetical protein Mal48_02660 [Thalassoglobus polymorphus]|uniref:Uncharacterized protein n=1 Tax=Thalassoglobus polymorphus TaxID=2527994 RepID=A0A517QHC5_9PLAN|nr:hypothetical protein Mal48_02660 [Thalassoglobus polymorphus]